MRLRKNNRVKQMSSRDRKAMGAFEMPKQVKYEYRTIVVSLILVRIVLTFRATCDDRIRE
jgi:hypothetical protein